MRVPAALLVILTVAVAGCAGTDAQTNPLGNTPGDGAPAADALPAPPVFDFKAGIPVPVWNVGDWWKYHVEYSSGESFDARIVVYAQDASKYYVTADDRDLILRAAITHYPTISGVGKSTMNQFIHGVEVPFLRFPMKNGTWEAPYRDFTATFSTTFAQLSTGKGEVPGFVTTGTNKADRLLRFTHGWSPVTKWFTDFSFNFDGVGPFEVTYTLQDWGTNFTGTVPVLEIIDGVHRMFPAVGLGPPNPASPPNPSQTPSATASFRVAAAGSSILLGMFAGAGGPGDFEYELGHRDAPGTRFSYPWRPTAAGSHFEHHEIRNAGMGEWTVTGFGSAQGTAILFLEAYEVRTSQVSLSG